MVAIAVDAQGAAAARPWVEKANGTFRSLLDQHNDIGKACNLKFVPVGIIVDETGRLVRAVGSVNIGDGDFRSQLSTWARTGEVAAEWLGPEPPPPPRQLTADEAEADARFQLALALLEKGSKEEALGELRKAVVLDQENWVIRKQMWAIETPGAFYDGRVDFGWQEQQRRLEAETLLAN